MKGIQVSINKVFLLMLPIILASFPLPGMHDECQKIGDTGTNSISG